MWRAGRASTLRLSLGSGRPRLLSRQVLRRNRCRWRCDWRGGLRRNRWSSLWSGCRGLRGSHRGCRWNCWRSRWHWLRRGSGRSRNGRRCGNWRYGRRWCNGLRRRRSRWLRPALGRFCSNFLGFALGIGGSLRVGHALQVIANLFGYFDGDRAGMGFLFRYAKPWQQVNNGFRLDLELTGEFIDADLRCVAHASYELFSSCCSAGG